MKIGVGLGWGLLALLVGLVNVIDSMLGIGLPVVDVEELAWDLGECPSPTSGY